jgi:hypothetical protein
VSFEVDLVAAETIRPKVPRKSDLLRAFEGYVVRDEPPISRSILAKLPNYMPRPGDDIPFEFTDFVVGTVADGECDVAYRWTPPPDPLQNFISVKRPLAAEWLWAGIYRLLSEFDLYMVFPSMTSVIIAHEVKLPDALRSGYPPTTVDSTAALIQAVTGSAGGA